MSGINIESDFQIAGRVGRLQSPARPDAGGSPEGSVGLVELVASDFLPPPSWPTLQTTLVEICLCLTEAVPSVESAGVVIFPSGAPSPGQPPTLDRAEVIGAAPAGTAVLQIERRLDEGPVLTAYRSQSIVISGDLSTDERWRRFGPAVADLQLHSAVAVPLPGINGVTSGVLSVHSDQRDAFDAGAIHLIAAVADVARHAMLSAELLERTTRALEAMRGAWERSAIVNQAVGVLIRWNCTEEEARSRLSRMARRGGDDLATSARMIVEEARREDNRSVVASRHTPRNA